MTTLETSELNLLHDLHIPALPPESDIEADTAICLAAKVDGTKSWVLARTPEKGELSIIRDYGTPAAISKIIQVRPIPNKNKPSKKKTNK